MFYTFIIQVTFLLVLVGILSKSNVVNSKDISIKYYKVSTVYSRERTIVNAINLYIEEEGIFPNPLTIDELKSKGVLSNSFVNNNGIDVGGVFSYTNINNTIIKIRTQITDNILSNIYINHYKGRRDGLSPYNDGVGYYSHEYQLSKRSVDILKGRVKEGDGYIPVGSIMGFTVDYGTISKCPVGWLLADGGVVSGVNYPVLNGLMTNTPDLRGEFLRGLDEGRGIDVGRVISSSQSEDYKTFTAKAESAGAGNSYNIGPVSMGKHTTEASATTSNFFIGKWENIGTKMNMWWDNSEIRPRNISVRYCIKHDYN